MNLADVSLATLAAQYVVAKAHEEQAIAERRRIGQMLVDAMPGAAEGSVSESMDGIKVTVTRKLTRTVDTKALQAAWDALPANVQETFRWSADVNTKHLRALQELNAPELAAANQFITSKPAAASVTVASEIM